MTNKQFDPYPWSLKDVIDNNFYEVPIYQRPYTWSSNEVDVLLDDIFTAYRSRVEKPNDILYTGQLFLRKKGKGSDGVKDKYEVVDGQQRLTTFSMILISIYSLAKKRGFQETVKEVGDLRSYLWKYSTLIRDYNKDERLITLSSIDMDIFRELFNAAYDNSAQILKTLDNYTVKCSTESNIRSMFHKIYKRIDSEIPWNESNADEILRLLAFLLDKTLFISIQSEIDMAKVFSVFESINSKGKPLEDIDKIKTYIFSELDESDYSLYLTRWGQLIVKTDDNLPDYLQTYIRAYLFYYRQKINLKEFKAIAKALPERYGLPTIKEALKCLLDNMLEKVDQYLYLSDCSAAEKLIGKPAFTTFYRLFSNIGYSHPRSLFFRVFCEYNNKDSSGQSEPLISKDDVIKIVRSATLFMFKFQSIRGGDSKDAIKYFENIAKKIYVSNAINAKDIEASFADALNKEGIDKTMIKTSFMNIDFYSKRELAYCVLSLLESLDISKNNKLLYSQASMMLSHMKDQTFHIDHMLPQTPDANNGRFKYYMDNSSGNEVLVLKDGHDFPEDSVIDGMKYDEFKSRTLNRLGNIRLYLPELNEEKGNTALQLPNHEEFTTYKQIVDRADLLADLLVNSPDLK